MKDHTLKGQNNPSRPSDTIDVSPNGEIAVREGSIRAAHLHPELYEGVREGVARTVNEVLDERLKNSAFGESIARLVRVEIERSLAAHFGPRDETSVDPPAPPPPGTTPSEAPTRANTRRAPTNQG